MSELEKLLVTLDRLEENLAAVKDGSLTGRDDLATTIHLLIGEGDGYDQIRKGFEETGMNLPSVSGFRDARLPTLIEGKNVALCLRTVNFDKSIQLPLPDVLNQVCVYHDGSVWNSAKELTWKDIVKKSRNKFASHIDEKPPAWLETLRYYPSANADVITLLLWSLGEALLEACTTSLSQGGVEAVPYAAVDNLHGISFQQGELLTFAPQQIKAGAYIKITTRTEKPRTILGGVYLERAFIIGVNEQLQVSCLIGDPGVSLESLESSFILGPQAPSMNRAARRAAMRNRNKS